MPIHLTPRILVAAVLALCAGATLLYAQPHGARKIMLSGDDIDGQPYTMEELGAIVVSRGGELEVLVVMPTERRPAAYRDVDVREGDQILMVNGKKMTSIDDLEAALAEVGIGDPVKLGLKRDKDMKIVAFAKADPDDLPKMERRMMKVEAGDAGKPEMSFQSADGADEQVAMLTGTGWIATAGEEGPVIGFIMPHAREVLVDADVQEQDRILRLQGERVADLDALSEAWDAIEIGDPVELVLSRGDTTFTVTFVKPEAQEGGGMMMITK